MGRAPRPAVLIIRKDLDVEEEEHVRRRRMLGSDPTYAACSGQELYSKPHVTVDWTTRPIFLPTPSSAPAGHPSQQQQQRVQGYNGDDVGLSKGERGDGEGKGGGGGVVSSFFSTASTPSASAKPTLAQLEMNLRQERGASVGEETGKRGGEGKTAEETSTDALRLQRGGVNGAAATVNEDRNGHGNGNGNGNGNGHAEKAIGGDAGERTGGGGDGGEASAGNGHVHAHTHAHEEGEAVLVEEEEEEEAGGIYDTVEQVAAIRAHLASSSLDNGAPPNKPSRSNSRKRLQQILSGDSLHLGVPAHDTIEAGTGSGSNWINNDPSDTGFFSSLIELIGEAVVGEELVVNNAKDFDRLQWQRVEAVNQPDGSTKKFVEAIGGGNENKPRYRVTRGDEGCHIRIVVSSRQSKDEVYGRETPIVTEPRRPSNVFDKASINTQSLDFLTSVGDGRRVSKTLNRTTNKIRRRMGISAVSAQAVNLGHGDTGEVEDSGDSEGMEVVHERPTIDFLANALSKHFLFTSVTIDTLEEVCKHMRFVQTPAGTNIIEQGQNGTSFYVVDSGEFKVVMKTEGHDEIKVLNTLRRGQCFGESVLMTRNLKRMATVRAVVDCGSWVVHRRVYEEKVLAKSAGSPVEEFLKGVDIFYRLAPAVVRGIAARCESLEIPAGTTLFEQGDYSDDMYFIVQGTVAVIHDGREVGELTTRAAFGEGSILAGKARRTAGIVTRTMCLLLKLPSIIMAKLLPLGLDEVLDEKLVLQVLKGIPGFSKLTEQMLRDCGVTENKHLQDAVLRSITLEPCALVAEERKPADAIFIVKRGGLMVTTRRQQKLGTQPRLLSERAYFGTAAAIADGTYHETAVATEELTQVLRLPATHMRMLRDACELATREESLKQVPILSTPSAQPLLKNLAGDSSTATFEEGTVIVGDGHNQNVQGENFYLIESGFVNLYKVDPETRQMRFWNRLGQGDYFGERALYPVGLMKEGITGGEDGDPGTDDSETVVAISEVECIIVSKYSFDAHMGAVRGSMLTELRAMSEVDGGGKEGNGNPGGKNAMKKNKKNGTLMALSRIDRKNLVVHRTLGMGRFGRVRLVQDNTTGMTYAMKMMGRRAVVEAGQESHVRNEVTVMKRISHPFCTNLYATYVDSRYFYMLLELTSGGELFRVMEQASEGRLTNAMSCFYAANVVCAFEYLHMQKIIYRDLKLENLMVDAWGFLKLVDFGFAKRVYGRTYTLCGTVDYLAPEIVSQQGHGFEVDLWALGVLVYEMLVGCPPFEGETKGDTSATYKNILAGKYDVPPGSLTPEASNLIDGFLNVDCLTRLGCGRTGMRDVKMHPWFTGLDWQMLLERRVRAPLVPEISNPLDTRNFDEYDECESNIDEFDQPLDALDELFKNY